MENLIIIIYETTRAKPDQTVTIPISKINIGKQLLPEKTKSILDREAIDISMVAELANKSISKGWLIQIETVKEKIEILVE